MICPVCRAKYEAGEDNHREPCPSCWKKGWRANAGGTLSLDHVAAEGRLWNDGLEQLERAGDLLAAVGAPK